MVEKKLKLTEDADWLAQAKIGVITALPIEFAAACEVLECKKEVHTNGRIYCVGTIRRKDYDDMYVVIVYCLPDMGNVAAAAGTMQLLGDCANVEAVIMCGIAGGFPNPSKSDDDIRLGDIVFPAREGVVQYDHESVRELENRIQPRWHRPSRILLAAARQLEAGEKIGDRPWVSYIDDAIQRMDSHAAGNSIEWRRPSSDMDVLQEFSPDRKIDYVKRAVRFLGLKNKLVEFSPIERASTHDRPLDCPKVFRGIIASAHKLQRNTKTRNFLSSKFGAIAVDMESAGVGEAAFERDVEFFAVRSVTDYCNEKKNIRWHNYCSLAAAAFTRSLIEITQLPRFSVPVDGRATAPVEIELAETVSQDLAQTVRQIVEDEVRKNADEIKRYLETWEFRRAYALATVLDVQLEKNEINLPKQLIFESYALLIRVETVRASQNRSAGLPVDTSRADYYLTKAKHVSGK